jgi:hypothetical protein
MCKPEWGRENSRSSCLENDIRAYFKVHKEICIKKWCGWAFCLIRLSRFESKTLPKTARSVYEAGLLFRTTLK